MEKEKNMKSILVGNGVNIQFGGKAYTSEYILQRIKYKAKQDKYRELFADSISGKEIVIFLDNLVDFCNGILNNKYDNLITSNDDRAVLQEFKERYKNWNITESKDIMLEDWFFLIHIFFLKNPDLIENEKNAIQGFEMLVLDAIYNNGAIQEVHKKSNREYKRFLRSFDKIFTVNYDNNIEALVGKEVFHLHGDFSTLADSENPSTVNGFIRTRDNKTVIIPNYEHCFCNALLNYNGKLKYKKAQENHKSNIELQKCYDNFNSNPQNFDKISELSPEIYELITTKIKYPELQMATEYHFEEFSNIDTEIHILGLSPNNDSHIIDLINKNDKLKTVFFYYFTSQEEKQARKIFSTKKLKCIQVNDLWKQLDCKQKIYNCNYNIDYSKMNILEICKLFSEYPSATTEKIDKEINSIPKFEMSRLANLAKKTLSAQITPKSEEELKQLLAEISFIALREGISPPVLYLITIMNFKEI